VSQGAYASLNLATHVGDDPARVRRNRQRLQTSLGLAGEPCWLTQVHGRAVIEAAEGLEAPAADASVTGRPGVVCAVLTADCLPVVFARRDGSRVGVAHAGWRGLAGGVLEATAAAMGGPGNGLLAWLGPGIGAGAYEVGTEVREAFLRVSPAAEQAFTPTRRGHWLADMYRLARQQLGAIGVSRVYGGGLCTWSDARRFFSYRRDGTTGRMATLVWLGDGWGP
jgi:hypothetical protein